MKKRGAPYLRISAEWSQLCTCHHSGLSKTEREIVSKQSKSTWDPVNLDLWQAICSQISLHLLIQSCTVQSCGDVTPEPESSSLDINKNPRCTSLSVLILSHLAPCRHTQPRTGLEKAEVEN